MNLPAPATLAAAFGMGDDQEALRAATRAVLERHAPLTVPGATTGGPDPWPALTAVGLPGALVPERWGGAGLGPSDVAVALEEAGRVLLSAPLLSTTLAVTILLAHADDALAARVLPGVADGSTVATVAVAGPDGWAGPPPVSAHESDGWSLTGVTTLVLDGAEADVLVVPAATPDGTALFVVHAGEGVRATATPALDVTRRFAEVRFTAAPAERLGDDTGHHLAGDLLDLAVVLLASEQVGAARRALEISVEHAGTRVQYGRAIGSFQAVKHRLADMLIDVEYAASTASYAAWAVTGGRDELAGLSGTLAVTVAEASVRVAEGMIQILGGTGFTWEHVAHLYYKRALSDRQLWGSPDARLDRSATLLGLTDGATASIRHPGP